MGFVDELKWRGMIHDSIPGIDEILEKGSCTGYIGFDPTASSLTVGNLVTVMMLVHFQRAGHKPIALVGGATGMIGDPSGKDEERKLLDEKTLQENLKSIEAQLRKFLDFDCPDNTAELVNNLDFYKNMDLFTFFRDIGKHLTVSYMTAKDSVKSRLESGMSFTEFSYQLFQAYDFRELFKKKKCILQMGGSDQWGNITSGTELIRRMDGEKAFALTCPLLTKSDGAKFGKTEDGNIWLDRNRTSPYKFYQFWLNSSDEDASKFIRIFSVRTQSEIESLEKEHASAPHTRILQKELAYEITSRVHSEKDCKAAIAASEVLFGKGTTQSLQELTEETLLDVFSGVPQFELSKTELVKGIGIIDFLSDSTPILPSKGEARRTIKGGALASTNQK